jgi:hypothetical protein
VRDGLSSSDGTLSTTRVKPNSPLIPALGAEDHHEH